MASQGIDEKEHETQEKKLSPHPHKINVKNLSRCGGVQEKERVMEE